MRDSVIIIDFPKVQMLTLVDTANTQTGVSPTSSDAAVGVGWASYSCSSVSSLCLGCSE